MQIKSKWGRGQFIKWVCNLTFVISIFWNSICVVEQRLGTYWKREPGKTWESFPSRVPSLHTQGGTVYWEDLDTFIFFVGAAKIESPFKELIIIVFSRLCVALVQLYNEVECCSFFSP